MHRTLCSHALAGLMPEVLHLCSIKASAVFPKHVTLLHQASTVKVKLYDVEIEGWLCWYRVPEECPAEIAQLYQACLSELPAQRPKAADLVRVIACAESAADAGGGGCPARQPRGQEEPALAQQAPSAMSTHWLKFLASQACRAG